MSKPWRSCSQLPAEILKIQFQHKERCSSGTLAMIAPGYLWSRLKTEKTIFSFSHNDFHIPILRLQEIWGSIRPVCAGPTEVSWDQLLKPGFIFLPLLLQPMTQSLFVFSSHFCSCFSIKFWSVAAAFANVLWLLLSELLLEMPTK